MKAGYSTPVLVLVTSSLIGLGLPCYAEEAKEVATACEVTLETPLKNDLVTLGRGESLGKLESAKFHQDNVRITPYFSPAGGESNVTFPTALANGILMPLASTEGAIVKSVWVAVPEGKLWAWEHATTLNHLGRAGIIHKIMLKVL